MCLCIDKEKLVFTKMETIKIANLEQVPAGLTLLIKEITDLKILVQGSITNQPNIVAPPQEYHTRKETAKRLNITLATLNTYTQSGKIVGNRIGNRVLYRESDINQALKKIKTTN